MLLLFVALRYCWEFTRSGL